MQIKAFITSLEEWAPLQFQESYDNVGLIVGDPEANCTGILCSLDCTEAVIDEAIQKDLKVMDATALTLCRDQQLPIAVFNIFKSGALKNILLGQNEGTLVMPNVH